MQQRYDKLEFVGMLGRLLDDPKRAGAETRPYKKPKQCRRGAQCMPAGGSVSRPYAHFAND